MDACTDLLECSVCTEPFTDARILKCGHTFCIQCLRQLEDCNARNIQCPTCRYVTYLNYMTTSKLVENLYVSKVKDVVCEIRRCIDSMQNDFSRTEHRLEMAATKAPEEFSKEGKGLQNIQEVLPKKDRKDLEKAQQEFSKKEQELDTTLSYLWKKQEDISRKKHELETAARKTQQDFSRKEQELKITLMNAQEDFSKKEQELKLIIRKSQEDFSKLVHQLKTALMKLQNDFSKKDQELNTTLSHLWKEQEDIARKEDEMKAALRKAKEIYSKNQKELETDIEKAKVDISKENELEIIRRKAQDNFSKKVQELEIALRKAQEDSSEKEQELETALSKSQVALCKKEVELETECQRLKTNLKLQERKYMAVKYELQKKTSTCEVLQSEVENLQTAHFSFTQKQELCCTLAGILLLLAPVIIFSDSLTVPILLLAVVCLLILIDTIYRLVWGTNF